MQELDSPPDPYQCFDVIAGTGTGAVQACMLGRLRMPVHSAIVAYANLAKDVFSEKKRWGSGSFKTTKLKDSLRNIIQIATGDPDEPMMDRQQEGTQCKTVVFAMSRHNMRAGIPTAFRSYHVNANASPECTIWEALCATMAHPDLFKSFDIGSPPLSQSFVDAGLGCNNPLAHVLAEVKAIYPDRYVASITSIGTGHTRTIQIPDTSMLRRLLPIAALVATKDIATDTERVAEEIARRFSSTQDVYFRLNVDQGLQSVDIDGWERLGEVRDHTRAYMRLVDTNKSIDKVAQIIHSRRSTVRAAHIDGEIQAAEATVSDLSVVARCPAPTPIFTGRELTIHMIESCISCDTMERKVCIVHGLGGTGKTQVVLRVIEETYDRWKEVVYIDASTCESIEATLKSIAIAKKVGNTYKAALQWLESYYEPWLMVLDNVDNPSLPIRDYIPGGKHGSIIITTRLSGMVSLAQGTQSDCNISSMDPDDAMVLLLKSARKQENLLSEKELESARALLQDMGHLALAVVHAGAFIGQSPHMSMSEYRSQFMVQNQRALEAYSKLPPAVKVDNYGHTVYTAWLMCYGLLSSRAQELLWLIACLHHTGISVDIFRRAVMNISLYKPAFPATQLEGSAQRKVHSFLCNFLDNDRAWDGLLFTETINEISSRSLLEYDSANQSYRIHVLVQGWVHTVVPVAADVVVNCAMSLLAASIPQDQSLESIMFRMSIGSHVEKVVVESLHAISPNHAVAFSAVFEDRGNWEKSSILRRITREKTEEVLGKEHPDTLASMNNLANTYASLGRYEDARALHSEALDACKQVLGNDHPDTLASMNNLAHTYDSLGRYEDARALYSEALDARKRVLGNDHPNTLSSMNNLAHTYNRLGRYEDARALHSEALDACKRVLGNDHPDTLSSMNNLASTYDSLGRYEDARALHSEALDARKRVLGNDHPDTLSSMNNLASTYNSLGRYEDARALFSEALDARKRVLGNDHPDTLSSMNNLAHTYDSLGRYEDARALHSEALDARKRVLGNDHPDTLSSMNNLASTYDSLGRYEHARALYSEALDARKRVLGNDHPDTLSSMNNLAHTYDSLGRYEDARALHSEALDAYKQVLGNDHPDTLSSMNNLASTYDSLGRYEHARALYSEALDARKRVLGNDHPDTLISAYNLARIYLQLDQLDEAESLQIDVQKFVQVFGKEHTYTKYAQNQLQNIQNRRGRPSHSPI